MNLAEYFEIGTIGKAKSFKGEVFLHLKEIGLIEEMENFNSLFVDIKGKLIKYPIDKLQFKNTTTLVIKFKGIDTPEFAEMIKNCKTYVPLSDIPESTEERIFVHDFIDCEVIDSSYGNIGKINYVDTSTPQTLAFVNYQNKEVVFPLIDEFIIEVKLDKKQIYTTLPNGILELNE